MNLPGTESQRKTHIGVIPQSRFSGIDSRLSTGTRAHSHLNPVQSRLSAMRGQNASKHSRMSATQRSRISHARSVKHASSSSVALAKNGGNPSSATSVSANEAPQMKRASKSYALGTHWALNLILTIYDVTLTSFQNPMVKSKRYYKQYKSGAGAEHAQDQCENAKTLQQFNHCRSAQLKIHLTIRWG